MLPHHPRGVGAASPTAARLAVVSAVASFLASPATRAPGEASWHRRARRARAEARVLLRLDAARSRLAAHHSAPFGGMRRGGGGGGGGGGAGFSGDANTARQLLLSLFDGALAGRGQGNRGGRLGGRGGGRQAAGTRQREGEWECHCGFATNRPHRVACFVCNRARDVAEVGGKGSVRHWPSGGTGQKGKPAGSASEGGRWAGGPVGAGGSRPLLGGRGREGQVERGPKGGGRDVARTPAWDGKGPAYSPMPGKAGGGTGTKGSLEGKGPAKGGMAQGVNAMSERGKGGKVAWERPRAVVDDEGYQLVQPRRIRAGGDGDGGGAHAPAQSGNDVVDQHAAVPTRRRWTDVDSDDDDDACDVDDCGDGDGDGANCGGDWGPDPRQLRAAFEEHASAVREMERTGGFGPALDTMRHARDEAEKRWREAKAPAPLPKRLIWAEAKLQQAQAALTRARLKLDQFDEETERRRAEYCDRIEEADRWYRWRQEQLEGIHAEAAGLAPGGNGAGASDAGHTEVRKRIRGKMLPEMQAILEEVQEGTALHERLALVVAELADAETKLGAPRDSGGGADRYDLCGGDSCDGDGDWGEQEQEQLGGTGGDHQGERPGGDRHQGRTAEWKPEGPGRWTRASNSGGGKPQPRPEEGAAGTAQVGEWAGAKGDGTATRDEGDQGDPAAARSCKHRRRQTEAESAEDERRASDAKRAQELREQLDRASAAQEQSYQEGTGGFGSEVALSWAAQKFVLDVQRAQAQAGEMGVEPRAADGRTLLELSPMELRQWIEENLEAEDMRD